MNNKEAFWCLVDEQQGSVISKHNTKHQATCEAERECYGTTFINIEYGNEDEDGLFVQHNGSI